MASIFNIYFLSFLLITSLLITPGFLSALLLTGSTVPFMSVCFTITCLLFFVFFVLWAGCDLIEDFESFILVMIICLGIGVFYTSLGTVVFLFDFNWRLSYGIFVSFNIVMWTMLELIVRSQAISNQNIEDLIKKYMTHPEIWNESPSIAVS